MEFQPEIEILENKKDIKNSKLTSLRPYVEGETDLLRINGRLEFSYQIKL